MSCPLSKNLTGSTRYSSHNSCRIVRSNGTAGDFPVIYNNGSARNQVSVILSFFMLLCCDRRSSFVSEFTSQCLFTVFAKHTSRSAP
jgi:hypothetical protein